MTITCESVGASAQGTTALSIPWPAGIVSGNLLVAAIASKFPPNGPSAPANWTLNQVSGGFGTNSADSGFVYASVMTYEATGSITGTLSVSLPGVSTSAGKMFRFSKTGASWVVSVFSGSDNINGSLDMSLTASSSPGNKFNVGDIAFVAYAANTDGHRYAAPDLEISGVVGYGSFTKFSSKASTTPFAELITSLHPIIGGSDTGGSPIYSLYADSIGANLAGAAMILGISDGDGTGITSGSEKKLYLSSESTSSPAPTSSYLLLESAAFDSESFVNSGEFNSGVPGNTDAGQWNPGDDFAPTTISVEIDNPSGTTVPIRSGSFPVQTDSPTSPSNTEIGDLVIVFTWTRAGAGIPTHTLQSGFSQIRDHQHNDGSTDGRASIAAIIATVAGAQTYNAYTSSGSPWSAILVIKKDEFDPETVMSNMASYANSVTATGTGASNPPSITLSTGQMLVCAAVFYHLSAAANVSITPPANYSEQWEVNGSADVEMELSTRVRMGLANTTEDPGSVADNVTPNGTCAITFGIPLTPRQESTSRKGWLWDQDLAGSKISAGTWKTTTILSATQGLSNSGRVCMRVSVVQKNSGAWTTKKQLLDSYIVGATSMELGQAGWRSAESPDITPDDIVRLPFESRFESAEYTFSADDRLFVELGFCQLTDPSDSTWQLIHNNGLSYIRTPAITSVAASSVFCDPFGFFGIFGI